MADEHNGRWHLRKKERKKKEVVVEEAVWKASGSSTEAWTALLSADYRHSWGNLWVWGRTRWHFELSLTKPGWSKLTACRMPEKCCSTNNEQTTGAATACECVELEPVWVLPYIHTCVHARCQNQTVPHNNIHHHRHPHSGGVGPDCGRRVVESSITRASLWSNQACPGVTRTTGPPAGCPGARGMPGFFTTCDGAHRSCGRWMDGRWLATRLELREADAYTAFHWWQISGGWGGGFGPPSGKIRAQLEVWRAHCSNCICLCKLHLWRKTGLLPPHSGWYLIKMTLAIYERKKKRELWPIHTDKSDS